MNILFEDENLIAVEKLAGEFIHPMNGERESKSNNLLFRVRDHLDQQVYLVNRLDRPVSGIVLLTKSSEFIKLVQEKWSDKETIKKYLALCLGEVKNAGTFDSPLKKLDSFQNEEVYQEAITHYEPIQFFQKVRATFLEIQIDTGRHHQIRRHFRKAIHPLIGDRKHGKGKINNQFHSEYGLNQLFLHSHRLEFPHPLSGAKIQIHCELNENLKNVLDQIR